MISETKNSIESFEEAHSSPESTHSADLDRESTDGKTNQKALATLRSLICKKANELRKL